MKKTAIFLLLLMAAASVFLLAGCSQPTPAIGNYVFDNGDFLSADQEAEIQNMILEARDKVQSDFVIYFTDTPATDNYRAEAERVNDAFIQSGGGYGDDKQTVLFYVDMQNRFFFVDEYNAREKWKLSDADIDSIVAGQVRNFMATGNYALACKQFVSEAYDAVQPGFFGRIWGWITSGLVGGGALSGILIGKHKRQPETTKAHYRKENARAPLRSSDRFLGTTTEVRHIQRVEPAPSGGGSGGQTISSSSGSEGHHGGGASF